MAGQEGGVAAPRGSARTYRRDIDGLRAIAILGVLAYHFGLGGVTGGYGGVDVFFVISGFLIAGIIKSELDAGSFSIADFYVRRIRRILPALTVCALTTTVFAALILFPTDFKNYGRSLLAVATSTSNFYFMRRTGYFDGKAIEKPLLHTWSLGVEEQFYALFPLLLLLLFRFGRRAAAPVLVLIAAASLAYSVREIGIRSDQAFFSTAGRAWELLIGALLAFGAIPHITGRPLREIAAAVGVLLISFGYFFYTDATAFPGIAALPFCVGAALIIHSGMASPQTAVAYVLSSPPTVALGLISYSVYLWHWPLFVLSQYRFGALHGSFGVLLAIASIGLGLLSWRFVEQPFRHTPVAASRRPLFVSAALAVAILVVTSATIARRGYWLQHWQPDVAAIMPWKSLGHGRGCVPLPASSGWPAKTCRIGSDAGAFDTVLWGDSHAEALIPGFDTYSQETGQRIIVATTGGCPPLVGVTFYGRTRNVTCPDFNEAVSEKAALPTIKRVILAGRWALYAEGQRVDEHGGETIHLTPGGTSDNAREFATLFEATVKRLAGQGHEVVIIGPVPEQTFSVTPTMARDRAWNRTVPHAITMAAFLERQHQVIPLLTRLSKLPNVRVVYPHERLCNADACAYVKNGQPLYRDSNHLNRAGVGELLDMIAEIFDPASAHYAAAP